MKTLGITYRNTPDETDNDNLFYGYADAAFTNTNNHKSTTGYVFVGSEGAITWKSKKQTMIVLSSTEAEYVTLSEAGCEVTWLKVVLTHNPQFHRQSKYITLHHHWV